MAVGWPSPPRSPSLGKIAGMERVLGNRRVLSMRGPPTRRPLGRVVSRFAWALDADENGLWRQGAGADGVRDVRVPGTGYFGSRAQQVMLNFPGPRPGCDARANCAPGERTWPGETQDMEGVGRFGWGHRSPRATGSSCGSPPDRVFWPQAVMAPPASLADPSWPGGDPGGEEQRGTPGDARRGAKAAGSGEYLRLLRGRIPPFRDGRGGRERSASFRQLVGRACR